MNALRQHVSRVHKMRKIEKKKRRRIWTTRYLPNTQTVTASTNNPPTPGNGIQTQGFAPPTPGEPRTETDQLSSQKRLSTHGGHQAHETRSYLRKTPGFMCGFCGRPFWHKNELQVHQRGRCKNKPSNNPVNGVIRFATSSGATVQPHYLSNQFHPQIRRSNSLPILGLHIKIPSG